MTPKRQLLIVDDDPHIRRLLRLYLRGSNFEVFDAATGEEAMKQFETQKIDVVLLDLVLPYHGGFRLCQRFKSALHPPRVVIMTGDDAEEAEKSSMDCGADAFIAKPFDGNEVVERVNALFASVE